MAETTERPTPAPAHGRRLIVASNRLPISLEVSARGVRWRPSSGGLTSALAGVRTDGEFVWVGWPGCPVPPARREEVTRLLAEQELAPVFLSGEQEAHYYHGVANQVLWPLFHYFTDRVAFSSESWSHYVTVNRMFADTILQHVGSDARVWVHDFHLMLVPRMLREERPDLEIGFFLHIPFPSSEIYRLLPTRSELLLGLLGADYIAFHTNDYTRHFRSACLRVLGLESDPDAIMFEGRRVGIGTDPIGIDVEGFEEILQDPDTARVYEDLSRRYAGRKLLLGVERLDYTKGIPHKLQAYELFLERDPNRAKEVTLLQVLVPSRLAHPEYQELKREIDETVGRLNGLYGGPGVTPVEYLHRSVPPRTLAALYRLADACLVTPVRDGMNLVAQEFVLCQAAEGPGPAARGMLVLSEFAGAAHHLSRALLVNPWDQEQTADRIEEALSMSRAERVERMDTMIERVRDMNCRRWAADYLRRLDTWTRYNREHSSRVLRDPEIDRLIERFGEARRRVLILDYDGTLREIARSPEEADPTHEIRELLTELADQPGVTVHLVSGRKRETMEAWFGDLPVYLCAEHGYVAKEPGGAWQVRIEVDLSWMDHVRAMLTEITQEVPGTRVEVKTCAVAWHYRMADLDYGAWRARELLSSLEQDLANQPVEVIHGQRVVEVRAAGVNKGAYVHELVERAPPGTFFLCIGDDRTDRDMYRVLPEGAVSIHVGGTEEYAQWTIESPAKVRRLLRRIANHARSAEQSQRP